MKRKSTRPQDKLACFAQQEANMKYKRNRTQSLTIRLTPTEKKMLQSGAAAKYMSMTDYLLLTVLRQSDASLYQPILQKLGEIKELPV